tara:strand:- start:3091 stop:4629 length:1539 start_codon:yes stop_codon:yes gene_type:complete
MANGIQNLDPNLWQRIRRLLEPESGAELTGLVGASLLPGVGEAIDVADIAAGIQDRDPLRIALATAGLAIPFVTGSSLKGLGKSWPELRDIKRKAKELERLSVEDMPTRDPIRISEDLSGPEALEQLRLERFKRLMENEVLLGSGELGGRRAIDALPERIMMERPRYRELYPGLTRIGDDAFEQEVRIRELLRLADQGQRLKRLTQQGYTKNPVGFHATNKIEISDPNLHASEGLGLQTNPSGIISLGTDMPGRELWDTNYDRIMDLLDPNLGRSDFARGIPSIEEALRRQRPDYFDLRRDPGVYSSGPDILPFRRFEGSNLAGLSAGDRGYFGTADAYFAPHIPGAQMYGEIVQPYVHRGSILDLTKVQPGKTADAIDLGIIRPEAGPPDAIRKIQKDYPDIASDLDKSLKNLGWTLESVVKAMKAGPYHILSGKTEEAESMLSHAFRNVLQDYGYSGIKAGNETAVFKGGDIRHIEAEFDPKRIGSDDLLAGLGSLFAAGVARTAMRDEN